MTTFSQNYSKNYGQKAEQKVLKNLHFGPKGTICKTGTKECVITKEISTINPVEVVSKVLSTPEWLEQSTLYLFLDSLSEISKTSITASKDAYVNL